MSNPIPSVEREDGSPMPGSFEAMQEDDERWRAPRRYRAPLIHRHGSRQPPMHGPDDLEPPSPQGYIPPEMEESWPSRSPHRTRREHSSGRVPRVPTHVPVTGSQDMSMHEERHIPENAVMIAASSKADSEAGDMEEAESREMGSPLAAPVPTAMTGPIMDSMDAAEAAHLEGTQPTVLMPDVPPVLEGLMPDGISSRAPKTARLGSPTMNEIHTSQAITEEDMTPNIIPRNITTRTTTEDVATDMTIATTTTIDGMITGEQARTVREHHNTCIQVMIFGDNHRKQF
ncbi:hypothetical protein CONPUDRAFT_153269 [Coniophora puteana RWD-64-598 SS2]|uniref:Uncharacterized protein n=1 Tax=Coniophora puteana (strain RWD-64-598) TaxID=741705 RepID=A0A5M3MTL8_CONPW|nr:uncharacterized protein CONPUDRAFT_153269 [Coniophora puteana RWD-64-598 SS2]EIW82387.1 hypothetical protein CONPUDRAFT_153269 [Coniophora puteana RWD-64-598 SS2]